MVGGSPSTPIGPHHQQSTPFRPSVAAAAEAAALNWFNVAAAGPGAQSLPVYQHHQPATTASPFALGSHFNAASVSTSSVDFPNAPVSSLAQHQQHLNQHYQQQDSANQNRSVIGSTFSDRKAAEMDALSSLSMLQKRHEQQQSQALAYGTPIFMQHQIRPLQYPIQSQFGNSTLTETTISNLSVTTGKAGLERNLGDYMHAQSQTDVRPVQYIRTSSPSNCEILPPAPRSVGTDRGRYVSNISAVRQPI